MAFLTTNPSPFIINVPEFQNVQNSATGASGLATLSNTVNDILTLIAISFIIIKVRIVTNHTSINLFTHHVNLLLYID